MLDLRSLTLKQLSLVKPHTKANTDQNCSFDAVITILFHSLIYAERCRVCSWRPWCPIRRWLIRRRRD
jgi:hypothetical protein